MAIYSPCCNLKTRELQWCGRKAGTNENFTKISVPRGISAWAIASSYAINHADDVNK